MADAKLEDIVSLAKRRGFVYPSSEVYGGLAGVYDYGPLGVRLKRNIINAWLKFFVDGWDDMYQVDAGILMNTKVWQASGHVDTFADPLIECNQCNSRFRVDHLIEDKDDYIEQIKIYFEDAKKILSDLILPESSYEYSKEQIENLVRIFGEARVPAHETKQELVQYLMDNEELANRYLGIFPRTYLTVKKVKCPKCGNVDWQDTRVFNMMFKTTVGPSHEDFVKTYQQIDEVTGRVSQVEERLVRTDVESSVSYLRPETAQGIFVNFKNVVDSFYPDLPFGIAQVGKAFRNEISPREFLFRLRELEQMEIEYFVHPDDWEKQFEKWRKDTLDFFAKIGLPADKIHELEVPEEDRAHYSKRTIDFEFDYPFGKRELSGLAYRTDFDLQNIQKASGKSMEYRPKDGSAAFVPHVIEPSFGVDRAVLAVLSAAYTEDEVEGEKRVYLKLDPSIAPVKVAVSPLLKNKPELVEKAQEVYKTLKKEFGAVMYDDNGNIGKRYRRQDEIGTPYCVTIDFETLQDNTVTVRHRDTTEQARIEIANIEDSLK